MNADVILFLSRDSFRETLKTFCFNGQKLLNNNVIELWINQSIKYKKKHVSDN